MTRRHLVIAYALLVAAVPFALWAFLPDMSEEGGTDYWLGPWGSDSARLPIGVCSLAVILGALVLIVSPAGACLRRRGDARVVAPLLAAGAYIAFTYRAATAAVGGANIGGPLLVMLGLILIPALLVASAIPAMRMRQTPQDSHA